MRLFDFATEFKTLIDLVENDLEVNSETGEITDNSVLFEALFDTLELNFSEKMNNTQRLVLSLEGEADVLANEIKRLQARKTALLNKVERVNDLMLNALNAMPDNKLKTGLYSFSIRTSEVIQISDIDEIPRAYLRLKKEADKVAIKKALKEGLIIDGCELKINKNLGVR